MSSSRYPWLRWVVIFGVIGAGAYAGYRYWGSSGPEPVQYQTAAVEKGDIVQVVTANGSLTPVRMVEVGSQISGVITDIKVDFNSPVKEGDIVAQIDPASYERALGEAEAQLANAVAALELAQLEYDRAAELLASKLISKSEFDASRVNLSQAKASVKLREAAVERARVDLNRTTIYAPMDGVVISRKVEAGQTVAASMNAPTLLIIANDLASMQIEAAVSEADVGGVEEGQQVQFTVDAFPGRQFRGEVRQVRFEPTTNQNVVTYTTVVGVENRDLKLRPGMTANARIITAESRGVLKIPNSALRFTPPAGAIVKGDSNETSMTAAPRVRLIESGPFAGLPEMPWQSGGARRRPTDEERAAYTASLTPEQKEKYERVMAEIRARFSQGGGPGGGGGGGFGGSGFGGGGFGGSGERRRAEPEGPRDATVYLVEKESGPGNQRTVLRPTQIKVGIGDGTHIEVLEGLKEGDLVATGLQIASATSNQPRANPFSPFGGRRR